jgi:hypothetical protein
MRGDSSGPSRVWVAFLFFSFLFFLRERSREQVGWVWFGLGWMRSGLGVPWTHVS